MIFVIIQSFLSYLNIAKRERAELKFTSISICTHSMGFTIIKGIIKETDLVIRKIIFFLLICLFIIIISVNLVSEEDIQKNRIEVFDESKYNQLSNYQKDFIYNSLSLDDSKEDSTIYLPAMTKLIDNDKFKFLVDSVYNSKENIYTINANFEWASEMNVKGDNFIFTLNENDWTILENPICSIYSRDTCYNFKRASNVTFSGYNYELSKHKIYKGTIVIYVKPITENPSKEIVVGYIHNKKKFPIKIDVKIHNIPLRPGIETKWDVISF